MQKCMFELIYRRAAQTPAGDSMAVAVIYADFGLAFFESTDICPRQVLCAPAL
jgi:hypothetical protein